MFITCWPSRPQSNPHTFDSKNANFASTPDFQTTAQNNHLAFPEATPTFAPAA
jgi:hypothetical protein